MVQENILSTPPIALSEMITDASAASDSPQTLSLSKNKWKDRFGSHPKYKQQSGLYIFWWKVNEQESLPEHENTRHWVKGKRRGKEDPNPSLDGTAYFSSGSIEFLHYRGEWGFHPCELDNGSFVPLYVGKSTNVFNRIKQHLSWPESHASTYSTQLKNELKNGYYAIPRYNSASQFTDHFHFLFRSQFEASQQLKVQHVYLSVAFTAFANYADRFFGEDWLIGKLRPPFNLDSER